MKNKKVLLMLAIGLIGGYLVTSELSDNSAKDDAVNSENKNESVETDGSDIVGIEKTVEEYENAKKEKIEKLTKKDLYDQIVGMDEYGIIDDTPTVDKGQLLFSDAWEEFLFDEMNLVFRFPSDQPKKWWVQKNEDGKRFVMTTSRSGEPDMQSDWAKITFGLYERTPDQSIFDWMKKSIEEEGVEAPPSDNTVQYVIIDESKFLGSVFFKDHTWTGKKNVYAELGPTLVFAASLEVQNSKQDSEFSGKFDQIFYTMLESLEIKP